MSNRIIHLTHINPDKLSKLLISFPSVDAEILYPERCALISDADDCLIAIIAEIYELDDLDQIKTRLSDYTLEI